MFVWLMYFFIKRVPEEFKKSSRNSCYLRRVLEEFQCLYNY
jgi:hypothetical protein